MVCSGKGIIFGTAMAEKRPENSKARYSAAYSHGARAWRARDFFTMVSAPIVSHSSTVSIS